MCKHWGLHISTNIDCLEVILGSLWEVWKGLLLSLEPKLRSWRFPRYWWFNKQYYGGYQLIYLISRPLLIALRYDWYRSKGLFKGFQVPLRPWESSKNWWRYGWMKFVIVFYWVETHSSSVCNPIVNCSFYICQGMLQSIPVGFSRIMREMRQNIYCIREVGMCCYL